MLYDCKFDPKSDIEEVVPNLSVDVGECMATGVVSSTGDTTPYTNETDIKNVGHYLRDKIQTCIAAMKLNQSMAAAAKTSQPATQQAASQPATQQAE